MEMLADCVIVSSISGDTLTIDVVLLCGSDQ